MDKKLRLLCLPPSAASAMMYLKWQSYFPEHVEIVPIELPGKGTKFREIPAESIDELTMRLKGEVMEKAGDEAYAIFGFCSGTILAFDLWQKLHKDGFRDPEYFIGASSRDPSAQINTPSALELSDETITNMILNIFKFKVGTGEESKKTMQRFVGLLHPESGKSLEGMDDEAFLKALKEDTEEGKKALEALRRSLDVMKKDSAMLHSYTVAEDYALMTMPVAMIHGTFDALVKRREVDRWKQFCANDFSVHMIAGGHLAVFDNYEGAIEVIKEIVL